jgi:acetyltransferase-like isoleucine patch superfamily enzyme
MHPIYDLASDERLNPAQDVRIGDKVWIGEDVKIMKGASIGRGSVIGSGSIVSGNIGENVIAAGSPAATVRENIRWTRSLPKD